MKKLAPDLMRLLKIPGFPPQFHLYARLLTDTPSPHAEFWLGGLETNDDRLGKVETSVWGRGTKEWNAFMMRCGISTADVQFGLQRHPETRMLCTGKFKSATQKDAEMIEFEIFHSTKWEPL